MTGARGRPPLLHVYVGRGKHAALLRGAHGRLRPEFPARGHYTRREGVDGVRGAADGVMKARVGLGVGIGITKRTRSKRESAPSAKPVARRVLAARVIRAGDKQEVSGLKPVCSA